MGTTGSAQGGVRERFVVTEAERGVADLLSIEVDPVLARAIVETVPFWFHTFALNRAEGIYTAGAARDHRYRRVATYFAAATRAALVLTAFSAPYRGRRTPVNAWWGSFDLAANLLSGLRADPPSDDFIMRNAMDAQGVAVGWWPGDQRYGKAAFYAYAHPAPEGFANAKLSPPAAHWERRSASSSSTGTMSAPALTRMRPHSSLPAPRSIMPAWCASGIQRSRLAPRDSRRPSADARWRAGAREHASASMGRPPVGHLGRRNDDHRTVGMLQHGV